jgi:hypothetical protein
MADSTGQPMLEVGIGADITQLQASLIAAENELRGFQTEIKKTTDTGRIAELSKSIETTQQKIAGLNAEISKSPKKMGDATIALTNVGRIASDASYGFIGIANNLNPMLESFQRLSKSEGGTTSALKAMASGLTGPAGIGVAIAVVSSLLVSFGDDISDFVNTKLSGLTQAMKLEAGVFKESQQGYVKATEDINNLNQAHDDYANGITSKEDFLKKFNSTLGDTIKKTDDLATAEKFLADGAEQYIQMMYYKAVATEALNQAAKKQIESLQEQAKPLLPTIGERVVSFLAPAGSSSAEDRAAKSRKQNVDALEADAYNLKTIAEQYKTLGDNIHFNLTRIFGVPEGTTKGIDAIKEYSANLKYELEKQLMDIEKYRKRFKEIDTSYIPFEYKDKPVKESEFSKKTKKELADTSQNTLGKFLTKDAKERSDKYSVEDKKIQQLTDSYENFANMLAGSVTNGIMSIFDAMAAGESPLEAIGQMFASIARNIAAAVIQAAIFEAILTEFPELKAIFAASGALQGAFGGKKLASGGITNGASIAMIGEAGPEAVLPLSKLNTFMQTSFNAGAMSGGGNGGGNGGQFVLRGQDLLVAINRTQKTSALKGQNISLI